MKLIVTVILALVLHVLLGWMWTVLAGVVAGGWVERRGWLVGGAGVGLGWGILVVYNFVVAAGPVGRMVETMGSILGNMPGAVVVGGTLLIGMLLGAVGGAFGSQLGRWVRR